MLGVCVPGQPHVEEHHQKHNDTRVVLEHGTFIKESNVGRDYLPVDEERCERAGSEGKVNKVVSPELPLPFDVLFFAVGDHVIDSDVPHHIQKAAQHTKYQKPY